MQKPCMGLADMLFDRFLLLVGDGGGDPCELHDLGRWRCDFDGELLELWAAGVTATTC